MGAPKKRYAMTVDTRLCVGCKACVLACKAEKNCPTGASHVNEGGAVLVTHRKCSGCKACIAACPYDARFVSPKGYVDKCTFCLHRVQAGFLPACVSVCPTPNSLLGSGRLRIQY